MQGVYTSLNAENATQKPCFGGYWLVTCIEP